jgi:hypothetical protein
MSDEPKSGQGTKQAVDVFLLVHRDLNERNRLGWKQHSKPLLTTDRMDSLGEAYAEALDLCVYLRKLLYERDGA